MCHRCSVLVDEQDKFFEAVKVKAVKANPLLSALADEVWMPCCILTSVIQSSIVGP